MLDEATIHKLQALLREKERQVLESNRIRLKHDEQIHDLKDVIDEERRKTMVDERKVAQMQKVLDQKIKLANQLSGQLEGFERKEQDDIEAINFLR